MPKSIRIRLAGTVMEYARMPKDRGGIIRGLSKSDTSLAVLSVSMLLFTRLYIFEVINPCPAYRGQQSWPVVKNSGYRYFKMEQSRIFLRHSQLRLSKISVPAFLNTN